MLDLVKSRLTVCIGLVCRWYFPPLIRRFTLGSWFLIKLIRLGVLVRTLLLRLRTLLLRFCVARFWCNGWTFGGFHAGAFLQSSVTGDGMRNMVTASSYTYEMAVMTGSGTSEMTVEAMDRLAAVAR